MPALGPGSITVVVTLGWGSRVPIEEDERDAGMLASPRSSSSTLSKSVCVELEVVVGDILANNQNMILSKCRARYIFSILLEESRVRSRLRRELNAIVRVERRLEGMVRRSRRCGCAVTSQLQPRLSRAPFYKGQTWVLSVDQHRHPGVHVQKHRTEYPCAFASS